LCPRRYHERSDAPGSFAAHSAERDGKDRDDESEHAVDEEPDAPAAGEDADAEADADGRRERPPPPPPPPPPPALEELEAVAEAAVSSASKKAAHSRCVRPTLGTAIACAQRCRSAALPIN